MGGGNRNRSLKHSRNSLTKELGGKQLGSARQSPQILFLFPCELFPKLFDIPAHRSQLHGSHFFPFRTLSKFAVHEGIKTNRGEVGSSISEPQREKSSSSVFLSLPSSEVRGIRVCLFDVFVFVCMYSKTK